MGRPKKAAVASLPDDPLVEILARLPIKELHRCKCVSKGWRDLISDPLHRKKLPQTLHGFFASYFGDLGSFNSLFTGSQLPVDPSFPFLKKLPGIHDIRLSGSCNGLLLFKHSSSRGGNLGYVVFNPTTEQWVAVPSEGARANRRTLANHTCLFFHPAVSPYFHLVIICEEVEKSRATVHSYSSETGVWRRTQIDWAEEVKRRGHWNWWHPQIRGTPSHAALLDSMLYFLLTDNQIAAVDLKGKAKRIIPAPSSVGRWVRDCRPFFIGQSQGRLYCINEEESASDIPSELSNHVYTRDSNDDSNLLSIWALEDYDTQKWALKHSVSCSRLFGSVHYKAGLCYNVVAIHPDNNNLVFIVLYREHKLISYGLNSKEVCVVDIFQESVQFHPYVPCFLDFLLVSQDEEKLSVKDITNEGERAVAIDHTGHRAQGR